MLTCTSLPVDYSALVKVESLDDGLNRATESQQSDDLSEGFLVSAKAVKGSVLALRESLFASVTNEAAFWFGMNANVAFAGATSGRAVEIRAK